MTNAIVLRHRILPGSRYVDLHVGLRPLYVAFKPDGSLNVWYECSMEYFNSLRRETWSFISVDTHEPIECPYPYIGTAINSEGLEVHVYGGLL